MAKLSIRRATPRSSKLPKHPECVSAQRRDLEKVRFASDSPLEGDGFEPSVPGKIIISYRFETVFRRFRNAPYSPKALHPFAAGTGSSNPLPSSGESAANFDSGRVL